MPAHSPYEVLEISKNATIKDIKRSYKDLVRQFTPEHHPEEFMEIRAAYDLLLSSEMNAQKTFPIYKKPLEFLEQSTETTNSSSIDRTVLGLIFETPYNTDNELEKLFKQND